MQGTSRQALKTTLRDSEGWGLYVHIPFCVRKCPYCDFTVAVLRDPPEEAYIRALWDEFDARALEKHGPLRTIYMGGGTPGLLKASSVRLFGEARRARMPDNTLDEFSVEFNPEHADEERLRAWVDAGATRISMGVQALHPEALKILGRQHQPHHVFEAIENARRAGFEHISIDFIFAVPGVKHAQTLRDIQRAVSIPGVDHISLYELTVEERTAFGVKRRRGLLPKLPDEQVLEDWRELSELLEAQGLQRYEVSNFARPNARGQHNAAYWTGRPYLGVGVGAASLAWEADENGRPRAIQRRQNRAQLRGYLQDPLEGAVIEQVTWEDHLGELLCLGIRTEPGLDLELLEARFGLALPAVEAELQLWRRQGLSGGAQRHYSMRRGAMEIADSLALKLLDALDKDLELLA